MRTARRAKNKNVLVGEVWVLGGQSNMEWRLIPTTDGETASACKISSIALLYAAGETFTPEKQFDTPESSKWQEASPDTVARWSGVGFYFGEQLMKDLEVGRPYRNPVAARCALDPTKPYLEFLSGGKSCNSETACS
ncbi:MAG: hypothetical protein ACLUKN_08845 [Bacilli bacterium]